MRFVFLFVLALNLAFAQNDNAESPVTLGQVQQLIDKSLLSKWYEKIQLKGYADFRYNRLMETNSKLTCGSCDSSIGDKQGFFFRRARLTFFGEINDKIFIYIQPDYTTNAQATSGTQQNYLQLRDAYFDYALTDSKEWRVRSGLSKVPFGFENLQSSSNRAALDRDDAINSAVPNERDTGVFLMFTTSEARKRFKELTNAYLKGTGDYGVFAIGAYNGQSMNRQEKNNDLHRVIRLTYPFKFKNGQFVEASLQAYEGKFFITGPSGVNVNKNFYDARQAASIIVYPQPIGFQAEYNSGTGPEYDPLSNEIRSQRLKGGYAQINYSTFYKDNRFYPYIKYKEYDGGKKIEEGALSKVREWEIGSEWQPNSAFELTVAYAISDRLTQSTATNRLHAKGNLLRLQAQFNY